MRVKLIITMTAHAIVDDQIGGAWSYSQRDRDAVRKPERPPYEPPPPKAGGT